MMNRVGLAVTAGWIALFAAPAVTATEDELGALAGRGNLAARQVIRTFTATMTVTSTHPMQRLLTTSTYTRLGDVVRIHEAFTAPAGTSDSVIQHGEIRSVIRTYASKGRPDAVRAIRKPLTGSRGFGDLWNELLLDQCDATGAHVSYEELIESSVVGRARTETLAGTKYVVVPVTLQDARGRDVPMTLWHDPARNYLVARREVVLPEGARGLVEITEWAEPKPGIQFPVRCVRTVTDDGQLVDRREVVINDIVINEPIPSAKMELPSIPSGTVLRNEIDGTTGPIDPTWLPLGARTPLKKVILSPADEGPASNWAEQSSSEPTSLWLWLAVVSGVALLVGVTLLGYLKYRLRGKT